MPVKTRSLPWFWVESLRFANGPAGSNGIHQRHDVLLVDHAIGLDDPHSESLLALASQRQHVAGHVHHSIWREHQSIAARLATDPRGTGRGVHRNEWPGYVAVVVFGIGNQMPDGEQVPALPGLVDELCHAITSTLGWLVLTLRQRHQVVNRILVEGKLRPRLTDGRAREPAGDGGADAELTVGGDSSSVGLDQVLHDGEPQPGATLVARAGLIGPIEPLDHPRPGLPRPAGP